LLASAAVAAWLGGHGRLPRLRPEASVEEVVAGTCGMMQQNVAFTRSNSDDPGVHDDHVVNPEMCCLRCKAHMWCQAWTWIRDAHLLSGIKSQCWLKARKPTSHIAQAGVVSGLVARSPADQRDRAAVPSFGCKAKPPPVVWTPGAGAALEVKALSFNLEWWRVFDRHLGAGAPALIARSGYPRHYDVMGFQECEDPDYVLRRAGLTGQYGALRGEKSLCMAYHLATWTLLSHGQEHVAADKQFGKRDAQWARLHHMATGRGLLFVNHHGPLPLNSGGVCGGAAVAFNLLSLVLQKGQQGDVVVLAGDFNSRAGSATIRLLGERLHLAVESGPDNVFTNLPRVVNTVKLGGGGSDHSAILALAGTADASVGVL